MIWLALYIMGAYVSFDHLASNGQDVAWWEYIVTPLLWPVSAAIVLVLVAWISWHEHLHRRREARR